MKIPLFTRLQPKRVVAAVSTVNARQAEQLLTSILKELPELLFGYVFDVKGSTLLACYTVSSDYDPHQLTLRNVRLLQTVQRAVATGAWPGGPCTDLTVLLDKQVHYLRPLPERGWSCFAAINHADANIAMVKEILHRATATSLK